jgi:HTH-type transcriptional regulator, transcriptional repressor of NAD biosynthesis genes
MALTVTLLGGESTGKSSLAQALQQALETRGLATRLVPEHLRQWCEAQGRAPRAEEQAALAAEQARLIEQASLAPEVAVVIADTAPLVIAAYSELYFNDTSLFPAALELQRFVDLTLLMGLDLPWVPDGLFRESPAVRDNTDGVLRRELHAAGLPFQTIYGRGEARLQHALRAVGAALGQRLVAADTEWGAGRYRWSCDRCSDPACEHRAFSRLVPNPPKTATRP